MLNELRLDKAKPYTTSFQKKNRGGNWKCKQVEKYYYVISNSFALLCEIRGWHFKTPSATHGENPCFWFMLAIRIGDYVLQTYVNESLTNQAMGSILDCFCKGISLYIAFTLSHWPEEAILDSYDKREPSFHYDWHCDQELFSSKSKSLTILTLHLKRRNVLTERIQHSLWFTRFQ